jgi:hypothetical protein
MHRRRDFILFPAARQWRVAVVSGGAVQAIRAWATPAGGAAEVARQAAGALEALGYRGEGVMLALPTEWCFAASVDAAGIPRRDAKAMLYRLEASLPVAAEDLAADFIYGQDADAALGVAVRIPTLSPILSSLEAAGVAVQSAVPAALLAAQDILERTCDAPDIVVHPDPSSPDACDLLSVRGGVPASWAQLCTGAADRAVELDLLSLELGRPPRITELTSDDGVTEPGAAREGNVGLVAVCLGAAAVLEGRRRPWVELRSGPLAATDPLRARRRPLNALLAAAAVLLMATAGTLLLRAARYAHADDMARQRLADAFRVQFPGRAVPDHVGAVLASERRKTDALLRGHAHEGADPVAASALRTLCTVLAKLPHDAAFALDHMMFDGAAFELNGRIASYELADALAAAARSAGYTVAPPEARRAADGSWQFTLRGGKGEAAVGTAGGEP